MTFSLSRIVLIALTAAIPALMHCTKEKQASRRGAGITETNAMQAELQKFAGDYTAKMKPITIAWWKKYFEAAVSGKKADWDSAARFEMRYNEAVSNKSDFAILKRLKESGSIRDSLQARQLLLMYNEYLGKQIDTAKLNAITKLQTEIERNYSNFRAEACGKKLTDNDVEEILSSSRDSKKLRAAWTAHKKIGPLVKQDVLRLVRMRNDAAREIGFANFHEMLLSLSDQNPAEITRLFDELDSLTAGPFAEAKKEMDSVLAARLSITPEALMPWHYQNRYFQDAPKIYEVDFDRYYKKQDIVKLTEDFFRGIGMPVEPIVRRSDLFEKKGKNQHGFMTNIDRDAKDIRVLCNIKPNADWMNTMLHEFGHASYEMYFDSTLPWVLKQPAHIFTTEAVAMLFGDLAADPQWMKDMRLIDEKEFAAIETPSQKMLRLERLVFSRWAQVMYRFEKSMYENPGQDLNALWWNLVERYQMIKKPAGRDEPDWAAKIHIATAPCYYHNYLIGYLLAAQLSARIEDALARKYGAGPGSFVDKPEVGSFLIDKVYSPGARYYWNDMIERATGEKLTAKYFARQINPGATK